MSDVGLLLISLPSLPPSLSSLSLSELRILGKEHAFIPLVANPSELEDVTPRQCGRCFRSHKIIRDRDSGGEAGGATTMGRRLGGGLSF